MVELAWDTKGNPMGLIFVNKVVAACILFQEMKGYLCD
jgi:hypothetical protein